LRDNKNIKQAADYMADLYGGDPRKVELAIQYYQGRGDIKNLYRTNNGVVVFFKDEDSNKWNGEYEILKFKDAKGKPFGRKNFAKSAARVFYGEKFLTTDFDDYIKEKEAGEPEPTVNNIQVPREGDETTPLPEYTEILKNIEGGNTGTSKYIAPSRNK